MSYPGIPSFPPKQKSTRSLEQTSATARSSSNGVSPKSSSSTGGAPFPADPTPIISNGVRLNPSPSSPEAIMAATPQSHPRMASTVQQHSFTSSGFPSALPSALPSAIPSALPSALPSVRSSKSPAPPLFNPSASVRSASPPRTVVVGVSTSPSVPISSGITFSSPALPSANSPQVLPGSPERVEVTRIVSPTSPIRKRAPGVTATHKIVNPMEMLQRGNSIMIQREAPRLPSVGNRMGMQGYSGTGVISSSLPALDEEEDESVPTMSPQRHLVAPISPSTQRGPLHEMKLELPSVYPKGATYEQPQQQYPQPILRQSLQSPVSGGQMPYHQHQPVFQPQAIHPPPLHATGRHSQFPASPVPGGQKPTTPQVFGYNPQQAQSTTAAPTVQHRPNYKAMNPMQAADMRLMFRGKFSSLRAAYPAWVIPEFSEESSLDQVHDLYEDYVKRIIISLNSTQYKIYLTIFFLAIEVFGIKVLGLDLRGYTKSQLATINRYDRLMLELGEKYYVQGNSNWPVEMRFMMMAGFNAIIFVVIRYLCKNIGDESGAMTGMIQGFVDQLFGGGMMAPTGVERDANGLPVLPTQQPAAAGDAKPGPAQPGAATPAGGGGFDLGGLLSGLMGGGGGGGGLDISNIIANLGSAFTGQMGGGGGQRATVAPNGEAQVKDAPRASNMPRRMPVFTE